MPYYGPQYERMGESGADAKLFEEYKFGTKVTETFLDSTSTPTLPSGFDVSLYDLPTSAFKQQIKFGDKGYITYPGGSDAYNWQSQKENPLPPADRIIYINESIGEKDDTGLDKWIEITLEALGADAEGKPDWASRGTRPSRPDPTYDPPANPLGAIVETETFTVTFEEFTPNVLGTAPYIDEDIRVIFIHSNGTEVECNSTNLSQISMTATYPETIKIKVRGKYTKWLFPYDTWEYYYERTDDAGNPAVYTPNPDHQPFLIESEDQRTYDESVEGIPASTIMNEVESQSLSVIDFGDVPSAQEGTMTSAEGLVGDSTVGLPNYPGRQEVTETSKKLQIDPNEFVDAYRITQEYKSGTGPFGVIKDLSVEVPFGVNILKYDQDPITDLDVTYRFSVTSVVTGGPNSIEYAVGTSVVAGDVVYVGDVSWIVLVGGFIFANDPPSGNTYYTDANSIEFQYRPSMLGTSFGAGEFEITQNVMNDYKLGLDRYEEVLEERGLRRDKVVDPRADLQ